MRSGWLQYISRPCRNCKMVMLRSGNLGLKMGVSRAAHTQCAYNVIWKYPLPPPPPPIQSISRRLAAGDSFLSVPSMLKPMQNDVKCLILNYMAIISENSRELRTPPVPFCGNILRVIILIMSLIQTHYYR